MTERQRRRQPVQTGRVRRTAPLAAMAARTAGDAVADILRRRLAGERGTSLEFHLRNAELLATALRIAKGVLPATNIDVRAVADEVAARIGEELDYSTELANQAQFCELYRDHPFIRIPSVFPELSGDRVLTMQLAH